VPELDSTDFRRPWIDGVVVVANLVADAVFHVTGATSPEVKSAIEAVSAHDRLASSTIAGRVITGGDGAIGPSSPDADWIDGFEDALCHLAGVIDLSGRSTSPFSVAVVGMTLTRNEWDGRADVDEVSRLLSEGLGLSVASCWPGTGTTAGLAEVARAGTILALPDGRRVARLIAGRTGARVVDVGLPLGFDGTARFMTVAGEAVGRAPRAADFTRRELLRIVPRFEWVVPHSLLNRRVGLVGDATFVSSMTDFLGEVGCDVCRAFLTGGLSRGVELPGCDDPDPDEPFDLVIGNGNATGICAASGIPFLEATWPCRAFHTFYPMPAYGFNGAAAILQNVVNRMNIFEVLTSWKNTVVSEEDREFHKARAHAPSGPRPA